MILHSTNTFVSSAKKKFYVCYEMMKGSLLLCVLLWLLFVLQWVKKVRTQLLHSYVVTLFSINHKMRTSACRALILFFQNHRMSEVFIVVCYAIVACLDPAHSKLIDATFLRKSVKSLRKTLNSAKTRHLSAYCA